MLAMRGYALVLIDLHYPTETAAAVKSTGASALELIGDISDEHRVSFFLEQVKEKLGRADVLVNNAGISCIVPAEETSGAQFRRVLEVNLLGAFLLAKSFGTLMLAQRSGSIINIASVSGLLGIADRVAYNASKHGLIGMTRTLAAEWGGRGVCCNAVCPGWVKTEMDAADQAGGSYTDQDITDRVPMGRFASPDDIANAVAFLADPDQSGFINGQAIAVDGGWTTDGTWQSLRLRHR
jgi:NAD(P)-dependent dehydrogenase (short-subunit alcohol dehydrogenase family)